MIVLDASAVLALLFEEKGASRVEAALPDAIISSVNLSEVVAKLQDDGVDDAAIDATLTDLGLKVIAFDGDQAAVAGKLRSATREAGLSLSDRACLALAKQRGYPALTGDRAWKGFAKAVGVKIELFR